MNLQTACKLGRFALGFESKKCFKNWSEWLDSNQRPSAPKAETQICYHSLFLQTVAAPTLMESKAYGLVANWRAFPLRKRQPLVRK